MNLFDAPLLRYAFLAVSALLLSGLVYFVCIGVRALFREARQISTNAGHGMLSASVRSVLRMMIWALFFGFFYAFAYFVGRRLGWWAVPVVAGGLALAIGGMVLAERLLTLSPRSRLALVGVGATLAGLLALLGIAAWLAR